MAPTKLSVALAEEFLDFVNASPSRAKPSPLLATPLTSTPAFHAVATARAALLSAGFTELPLRSGWGSAVRPGGKYLVTRNGSTLAAFAVGGAWRPGGAVGMVGAHTDSPCLRVKPVSRRAADGFLQVGVETYGGGLWHTWFDRDLGLAGRAMVRVGGKVEARLVRVDRPVLRIPSLAIHLDRQEKFEFNKEAQLFPIAGLVAAETARGEAAKSEDDAGKALAAAAAAPLAAAAERHHPRLVELLAESAGCAPADIVDFEVVLYDTQKAALGGLNGELIFSARLDNLNMSFCAVRGLIASLEGSKSFESDPSVRLIALFDHEEIGSRTAQGADSNLLPSILRRLSTVEISSDTPKDGTAFEEMLEKSFLVSADMAHSVHPNYGAKHEALHRPEMNRGVVIKVNANARYATNAPGIVLLQEAARRARPAATYACLAADDKGGAREGVPLQLFVVRNDSSCGSTIGPMLSAKLGVRTIDVGSPQLSMHSIRETGGAYDVEHAVNLFESLFEHYGALEATVVVDGLDTAS
jgi:aspartyl aminopeptidase